MALTLNSTISVNFTHTKTQTGLSDTTNPTTVTKKLAYTDGSGAGNANELYASLRTLAGGATDNIDLAGALTNLIGDTVTFLNIKGILIWLLSAADTAPDGTVGSATTSITVGNHATAAFVGPFGAAANTHEIKNGGFYSWGLGAADGYTVTPTTADILKVLNNDASVAAKYILIIWGDKS